MSKEPTTNPLPYVVALLAALYCCFHVFKPPVRKVVAEQKEMSPPRVVGSNPAAGEKDGTNDPATPSASASKSRVVLVSLDGMHVKLIDVMPHLRQMFAEGSHTLKARVPWATLEVPDADGVSARISRGATTAISHAALFTGADPEVNGVTNEPWDDAHHTRHVHGVAFRWTPLLVKETLFTAVEQSGRSVRAYVEKGKLVGLLRADGSETGIVTRNSIDRFALRDCEAFKDASVGLIILHFKMIDGAGHSIGWLTPEQYKEAEIIDSKLKVIRDCINAADARDGLSTTLIVTADHGGTPGLKKGHSANDDDNRLVPWVAVGPGIKRDYEIAGRNDLPPIEHPRNGSTSVPATINLYDTVPTVLRILGLPRSAMPSLSAHAKSVDEIFASP